MNRLSSIRAVLFDLDGTLLDTIPDIGASANMALAHAGLPLRSMEEYKRLVGHGIRVLFRMAVPEGTDDATYEKALAFYLSYYPDHATDLTDYFPQIPELVERLAQKGYQLGIISNKTEKTATKIMKHYFPETEFAFVWGNNGERPLKPSLEAGEQACSALGLSPEEIAYVGDGDTDMEFASKMGYWAIGVSWGNRSREQLIASGADIVLDSVQELMDLLKLS